MRPNLALLAICPQCHSLRYIRFKLSITYRLLVGLFFYSHLGARQNTIEATDGLCLSGEFTILEQGFMNI